MMRIGWMVVAALLASPVMAQDDADGVQVFARHCAICHNDGGIGTPGLAPPLDRPAFWQELGDDAPAYIASIIARGFTMPITVRGERYIGMFMQPVAATDEESAIVVNWLLNELGQMDVAVTAEDVTALRNRNLTNGDLRAMRPESE